MGCRGVPWGAGGCRGVPWGAVGCRGVPWPPGVPWTVVTGAMGCHGEACPGWTRTHEKASTRGGAGGHGAWWSSLHLGQMRREARASLG